jgi:hypothetical protein
MRITFKGPVLIVHFEGKKDKMNEVLDCISNKYEGPIKNREGHNFPSECIPSTHLFAKYKVRCKYVIGVYNNKSIQHELLHAKYHIDKSYAEQINREWTEMDKNARNYIIDFLRRLGYSDKVIIDEYQAYRYTEAPNFFGIKL